MGVVVRNGMNKHRFLLILEFSPFFVILVKVDLYVAFFNVEIDRVNQIGTQKSVKIVIKFNKKNHLLIQISVHEMIENSVDCRSFYNFELAQLYEHLFSFDEHS